MKNNSVLKYIIIKTVVVGVLCIVFHFAFDFFNKNVFIGAFVPVNESVWEHLKLTATATLIFAIFAHRKMYKYENYLLSLTFGVIIPIITILLIYYTFKSLGIENAAVDISSLYIGLIISAVFEYKILTKVNKNSKLSVHSTLVIIILQFFLIFFTYNPPKLELFKDNIKQDYGIFEEGK